MHRPAVRADHPGIAGDTGVGDTGVGDTRQVTSARCGDRPLDAVPAPR
ncbi:MAG TPA: hypothetical protein VGD37_11495 [Kofleriaceae bacterium]